MTELDFIIRVVAAIFLGSAVGIERQWRQRMAGLRTNALVSAGAALFVSLSQMIPTGGDQSRIASYVVSGIGFLGAGVIMKEGPSIRGLNTAATLWCSAAIGSLTGFGFYFHALLGAIGILATNVFLRPLAQRLNHRPTEMLEQDVHYQIKATCRQEDETHVRFVILQSVAKGPLVLHSLRSQDQSSERNEVVADLECLGRNDSLLENVVSHLSMEKGVSAVAWTVLSNGGSV
jgi:putative Mg2+ transporter-C (MgtC) family protein